MIDIILTIAPIFLIMALGALAKYAGLANDTWIEVLNKFALYIAFPALIFSSLASIERGAAIDYSLFLYHSLLLIGAFVVLYLVLNWLKVKKDIRNCYLMCAVFGNTAYFGFPYITSLIAESGGSVSIIVASCIILMFTMGLWVLENSRSEKSGFFKTVKNILKNPMLLAVIFGILFIQLNMQLPGFLDSAVQMLAKGASPVVLFALGVFLVRKIEYNKKLMHSMIITALKLIALPLLFVSLGVYLFKDTSYTIAVLESGMPTALTWFALAQIYPLDKKMVVYVIVISTVLSAITLPILTSFVL